MSSSLPSQQSASPVPGSLDPLRPFSDDATAEYMMLDLRPETVHCWRKLAECEESVGVRRSKHTLVFYKGRLYVFGGDNGKTMLNDLIRYDIRDNVWTRESTLGSPPAPRYHHTAVVYGNSMFVFGGYTGDLHSNWTNKNDLHEYRFNTCTWIAWQFSPNSTKPVPRAAHGAAVYGDRLWVFAGYDGSVRLNDMWNTSLMPAEWHEGREWAEVAQMGDIPPPCCNFAMTVADGSMYVFSGSQSGAQVTNKVFQFDFDTVTWTRISTDHILRSSIHAPSKRFGHTMVAFYRNLYVFGGAGTSVLPNYLYCYDLDTHLWSLIPPMEDSQVPCVRLFHAATVVDSALYIFGGAMDNSTRFGDLYRIPLANYPKCTLREDFAALRQSRGFCDLLFRLRPSTKAMEEEELEEEEEQKKENKEEEEEEEKKADEEEQRKPKEEDQVTGAEADAVAEEKEEEDEDEVRCVEVQAHTAFVAARSPYLRQKIRAAREASRRHEGMLIVELEDVDPRAMELLLSYIYTDQIQPSQTDEEPYDNATMLLMIRVYQLSVRFELRRLKYIFVHYFDTWITQQNVLVALKNASRMNLQFLKEYCMRFIVKEAHFSNVVMSPYFEKLDQKLMVEIIRRKTMPPSEVAYRQPSPMPPHAPATGGYLDCGGAKENALGVVDVGMTEHVHRSGLSEDKALERDMESFLLNGREFCDITLLVDKHEFYAHKAVLISRSKYFEAMYRSMPPEDNRVRITIGETVPTQEAFKSLLRYIYFGDTNMPPQDSLYLFTAPFFYQFTNLRLQAYCKQNLEVNISIQNIFNILDAADKINAVEMKRRAMSLIVAHLPQVAKLPHLRSLSRDLLVEIIQATASASQVRESRQGALRHDSPVQSIM